MFNKIKKYIPKFFKWKDKPNQYSHYIKCFQLFKNIDNIKYMYDVRFSLLIQEMLTRKESISKEGLAEVNLFMQSFIREIERGSDLYIQRKDEIDKWCIDNHIKINK